MLKLKLKTPASRRRLNAGVIGALLIGNACHMLPDPAGFVVFPEAHSRNLSQLHATDGSYKYSGVLLGDFGYLVEELRRASRDEIMSPSVIPSPSSETLANLNQLLSADHGDPNTRAEQLRWCARLVQGDASDLVREIAADGLADIGLHLQIKEFAPAPPPLTVVSPDDLAAVFESLLRETRLSAEVGAETAEFRAACHDAMGLALDLDGAWRLHHFAAELRGLEMDASSKASLHALVRELEETLVGIGLYTAITDSAPRVAITALEGYTRIIGPEALLPYLASPEAILDEPAQFGLLGLVRTYGLPEGGMTLELRRRCLRSLMALGTAHPSARIRVQAMLALQAVTSDGPKSLREEDWVHWSEPQTSDMAELP